MAILQSDGVNNATDLILRRNGTEGLRLTSSTVQVSSINDGPLAGFRNAIINGNFDIWQRGTSAVAFDYATADRWSTRSALNTGGSLTQSRQPFALGQTAVPGEPTYYWRLVFTGSTSDPFVENRIEGVRSFAGQTVTISFWAKRSSASPNCFVDIVQIFGSGGSPSAQVATTSTSFTVGTAWTYITQTLSIPSISGKTLGTNNDDYLSARIRLGGTGSFTFELAQVQVEPGPVATPFERRPIETELALCQRYYEQSEGTSVGSRVTWNGDCTSGIIYYATRTFEVRKRSGPTITLTSVDAVRFPATAGTVTSDRQGFREARTSNSTGNGGRYGSTWTANAEL